MAGPDLSPLTAAVDFSSVVVAVLAVAAAVVVVRVAWEGASMVIGFLRGDYDYGDGKDLLDYERQDWAWDDPRWWE